MGINIADNFAYNGKKPLDNRTEYTTLSAMKSVADANINEGCLAYNKEDGKYYKFLSTNTVDATTGKWREFETGGGGQTYNDFTGATASTAGAHGLVPAPSAGDEGKVLFGNGAWGNIVMPSVDLSNSSVESDILDTTEKAVGTTTDGYLIYQKVVSTGGSVPSGATLLMRVQLLNSTDIIRYTKTTDSPLPSDVKFAGVDENGSVIYKRMITFSNGMNLGTNDWNFIATETWIGQIDKITGFEFFRAKNTKFDCETVIDGNSIKILPYRSRYLETSGYAYIYYTLAS